MTKLVDLSPNDLVCSVAWSLRGTYLSVGTSHGDTRLFDVSKLKQIRIMTGHRQRVGTMAWSSHLLSTGSRDKTVLQRDVRVEEAYVQKCALTPVLKRVDHVQICMYRCVSASRKFDVSDVFQKPITSKIIYFHYLKKCCPGQNIQKCLYVFNYETGSTGLRANSS